MLPYFLYRLCRMLEDIPGGGSENRKIDLRFHESNVESIYNKYQK